MAPTLLRKWWIFITQKASQQRYLRRVLADRYEFAESTKTYLEESQSYKG